MIINFKRIFTALAFLASLQALVIPQAWSQDMEKLATSTDADRQQILEEGAKKEGALALYTTIPAQYAKGLVEPFEKKYGVKVAIWRARSELITQRVINEAHAGKPAVDVVISTNSPVEALSREKLLQKVISPYQKELMPSAVPDHHEWVSTNLLVMVQAYNTKKVKKEDLPKTYKDLLDPKWKDKLAIEGSDFDWMTSVIDDMGEKEGTQFFKELVAKNHLSVRDGHPLLTNLVGSGEVPLALTVYQYSVEQAKKTGAPIDWFAIEPAITITNAMGVLKKAPHPNAALLFYDYILSEPAQEILAKIGYYAANTKVKPPFEGVKFKILDAGKMLDEQDKSYQRFEAILQGNR